MWLAEGLDRVVELDSPAVHRVALGRQRVGDVLGGDGAEQLAFLAGLARQCERHRAERGGGALGLDPLGLVAGRPGAGFPSDPLLVTLGGLEREPSGQEKVARVAGLDPDHLAGFAERLHVFAQDHFNHRSTPVVVGVVSRRRKSSQVSESPSSVSPPTTNGNRNAEIRIRIAATGALIPRDSATTTASPRVA